MLAANSTSFGRGALRGARLARGLAHCPFAFSPGAMQLAQLPEFAQARDHAARGELALAAPLIARTVEVCTAMHMPSMELLALEATAYVQGTLGHARDELRTRKRQRALAAECGEEERLLVLHGLVLARLRAGDADGARAVADEGSALAGTQMKQEAGHETFALHGIAASLLGASPDLPARVRDFAGGGKVAAAAADGWRVACAQLLLAEYQAASLHAPADALATLEPLCAEEPTAPLAASPWPGVGEARAWALQLAGRAHLSLGALSEAEQALSHSLALWREQSGDGSRPVALCTADLGALFAAKAEPIMAEGLLRSSTDTLVAAAGANTVAGARALRGALLAYAALLDGLETNGRKRSSEAAQLRGQADELAKGFEALASPDEGDAKEDARRGLAAVRQPLTRMLLDWYIDRAEFRWFADTT